MPMLLNNKEGGSSAAELVLVMDTVVFFGLFYFNIDAVISNLGKNRISFVWKVISIPGYKCHSYEVGEKIYLYITFQICLTYHRN